jgi:hypothetical protein
MIDTNNKAKSFSINKANGLCGIDAGLGLRNAL